MQERRQHAIDQTQMIIAGELVFHIHEITRHRIQPSRQQPFCRGFINQLEQALQLAWADAKHSRQFADREFGIVETPVDPLKIKSPPTEPIAARLMKDYTLHRDSMMAKLKK